MLVLGWLVLGWLVPGGTPAERRGNGNAPIPTRLGGMRLAPLGLLSWVGMPAIHPLVVWTVVDDVASSTGVVGRRRPGFQSPRSEPGATRTSRTDQG